MPYISFFSKGIFPLIFVIVRNAWCRDDALEGDGEEEETDQLVSQVLDEIGVDLNSQVPDSPFN